MKDYKKEIFNTIEQEKQRQIEHIELIASENYVSKDVLKAQGSILTNKYAEGYPNKRYYGWCENVDKIESLAISLAKKLFSTDYEVNVQPHSWSSANMGVYLAVLKPWDKILGLSLNSGWHLTHGSKPSFSGEKYGIFKSASYWVDENWLLDYENIRKIALKEKPQIIVAWASAYSRIIDWTKFREIADEVWAYLLVDMAHIAWLIATWLHPSPFGIADFVTTTTHKTLRWPRGWVIFSKNEELWKKVNSAIFPGIQGWPLEHVIAAKAVCFAEALTDSYKEYMKQVIKNAKTFEEEIKKVWYEINGEIKRIKIVSWWTDNHLLLLDFRELWISWTEVENLLADINVTVNKNTVPGDEKPWNPSWIRIWTPAITSRWVKEWEIAAITEWITDIIRSYIYDNSKKERSWKEEKEPWTLDEEKLYWKEKMSYLMKDKTIYPEVW